MREPLFETPLATTTGPGTAEPVGPGWRTGQPGAGRAVALALVMVVSFVDAAGAVDFEDVAPVLASRCVVCHSGSGAAMGLRLDTLENLRRGSSRGAVVVAGDPAGSELIRRIRGDSQPRMPMTGPPFLSPGEIGMFEAWVAGGLASRGGGEPLPKPSGVPPAGPVTYAQVAPIFATRCVKCHRDGGQMGAAPEGYRLNSYAETLSAVDRVRVVPGQPAASELLRRIRGQARPRMPLDGPPYLEEAEMELIEAWISEGARSTEGAAAPWPSGARLRLHGTLRPGWRLDGLPLEVTSRTRLDKSPGPGDYVRVRGRLGADGTIEVERVRPR